METEYSGEERAAPQRLAAVFRWRAPICSQPRGTDRGECVRNQPRPRTGRRRTPMKSSRRAVLMAAVAAAVLAAVAGGAARPARHRTRRRSGSPGSGRAGSRRAPPRLAGIRAIRVGSRRAETGEPHAPTTGTASPS